MSSEENESDEEYLKRNLGKRYGDRNEEFRANINDDNDEDDDEKDDRYDQEYDTDLRKDSNDDTNQDNQYLTREENKYEEEKIDTMRKDSNDNDIEYDVETPALVKNISEQSKDSQDSVDMVFPHLNKEKGISDDSENPYSVTEPVKGSHVSYTVKGIDNDGTFLCSRRYNDFYCLRNTLISRWPGIYFPPIPPKKKVGNKEVKFVEERRYYLERFLRKLANFDYILSCEEFKIFARINGNIDKFLTNLPKQNIDTILTKYKAAFKLEDKPSHDKIINAKAVITDFKEFSEKIVPIIDSIKLQVKALTPISQQHKQEYYEFLQMLEDYEEKDLSITSKIQYQKLIVNSKSSNIIKKKIKSALADGTNPFKDLYYWSKGELNDFKSMQDAISGRNDLEDTLSKLEQK